MQTIPLQPVPNQTLQFAVNNQAIRLRVYQKFFGLLMDVSINGSLVAAGCLCRNQNRVLHNKYLGFPGDLVFVDEQGGDDPVYTGFGSRFVLLYLSASDVTSLGLLQ